MSILTGKHILVVGVETNQISKIEAALITYGAAITSATCEETDARKIASEHIDMVLLNHLHDGKHCRNMLESLKTADFDSSIPIFVLVENEQRYIADALMLGAADYIVPNEDVHGVVEKMKIIFGEGSELNDNAAIDITPSTVAGSGAGIRVFAVEDDPLLRNLLAIKFEKSNVPFQVDTDGDDLLEKVKTFRPQIVILDLMLPGKNGFELMQELLSDDATKNIPIIIFSNKDSQEDRQKAQELGAKGFFVKAMTDLSDLMNMIDKYAAR